MRIRLVIPAALLVAAAYAKGRQDAAASGRPLSPPACEISHATRMRAEAEAADALELIGDGAPAAAAVGGPPAGEPAAAAPVPVDPSAEAPGSPGPSGPAQPIRPEDAIASPPERTVSRALAETAVAAAPVAEPLAPPVAAGADPWRVPEFPFPARRRPAPAPDADADADAVDLAPLGEWVTTVVAGAAPVAEAPAPPVAEVRIDEHGRFSLGGWAAQPGHMALCGVTFRDRHDRLVSAADVRLVPDALANVADGGLVVLGDPGFAPDGEGFTLVVSAAGPGAFAAAGRYELVAA